MKLTGKLKRILTTGQTSLIELEIPTYQTRELNTLEDKDLVIDLKSKKEAKTDSQRRYAWVIINEIDKKLNGYVSDLNGTYENLLQQANIDPVFLETIEQAIPTLNELFRVVEIIEPRTSVKGVETVVLKCINGISKLDKQEMSDLIEVLLKNATELEIDIDMEVFR